MRPGARRRSRAYRAHLACGRGCRARRKGSGDSCPFGRRRAECDPLDKIRIEQLAAGDGADLRYVAGARISRLYGAGGEGGPPLAPRKAHPRLSPDDSTLSAAQAGMRTGIERMPWMKFE